MLMPCKVNFHVAISFAEFNESILGIYLHADQVFFGSYVPQHIYLRSFAVNVYLLRLCLHGFLASGPETPVTCVAGSKRGGGGGGGGRKRKRKKGSACYKSRCFCMPHTIFSINPIISTVKTWPTISRGACRLLSMVTGNCQVETLFSIDIKIERNKPFLDLFTLIAPAESATNIDYEQSLFFCCSRSTTNNDQFRVNTHDFWYYLIKHNGHINNRIVASLRREEI